MKDNIIGYAACFIIVVLAFFTIFYHYNWALHVFISQDVSQILSCISMLFTLGGAAFAYYKWFDEKKNKELEKNREIKEKLLINFTDKFISHIKRQETYRQIFLDNDERFSQNNLPLITPNVESRIGAFEIGSINKDSLVDLLSNADMSFIGFNIINLRNQFLVYNDIERIYREAAHYHYDLIPGFVRMQIEQIDSQLNDIYNEPNATQFTALRLSNFGQEYAQIVIRLKNIESQLIKAVIDEYNDELDILNIKHNKLTWENIIDDYTIPGNNLNVEARRRVDRLSQMSLQEDELLPDIYEEDDSTVIVTRGPLPNPTH